MSKYVSKKPDEQGHIYYTDLENQTWSQLIHRQLEVIKNRASAEFLNGIQVLDLPLTQIPQLKQVNSQLKAATGWQVEQVPAIIKPVDFFKMLSNKSFPAATFIRVPEEIDYLQEPDIFHEIFGHCPMICYQPFSDFMKKYGELALNAPKELHKYYAKLFWFTVEFGLIEEPEGLRCYGGGILSSMKETVFALEDKRPSREPFDLLEVLRTQYRYDQIQPKYFVIKDYAQLYELIDNNLEEMMRQAIELGEYPLDSIDEQRDPNEWVTC